MWAFMPASANCTGATSLRRPSENSGSHAFDTHALASPAAYSRR